MATADVSYVPGALTAVAGDQCWALVEISPDSPAVGRIWQQLGQGVAADALLASLVANGMGGTPGFTLLVAEAGGQHRLFCRGTVGATVVTRLGGGSAPQGQGQAAAERIDGAGLLTWREQVVGDAERIILGEPPADTAVRLPATSGVLLAGCVVVDLASSAAPERTAVFFPDTITMTRPGSVTAPAAVTGAGGHGGSDDPESPALAVPTVPSTAGPAGPPVGPGRADDPGPSSPTAPPSPAFLSPGPAVGATASLNDAGDNGEYDFLWGATQARSVEGAAMRDGGEGVPVQPGHFPLDSAPVAGSPVAGGPWLGALPSEPLPVAYPDGPPSAGPRPGTPGPATPGPAGPGPLMPGNPSPANLSPPPPGPVPGPPPGGLIDAPQWLSGPGQNEPPPDWTAPAASSPGWVSPGEQPYVPAAPRAAAGPGDSGSTVKRGELAEIVARTSPPDRIGPVVPALICPAGHVNPPSGVTCRRCGGHLPHDPVPVPRPVLGVLRLSQGDVITLDRGVLMGRNPRTDFGGPDGPGGPGGVERPHVVKLPSADGDISRTHLRVTLDGWHVLVTDLHSTNGTLVTLPGREPVQLRPGEPMPIQPGTVVTLADDVDFRYEVAE